MLLRDKKYTDDRNTYSRFKILQLQQVEFVVDIFTTNETTSPFLLISVELFMAMGTHLYSK